MPTGRQVLFITLFIAKATALFKRNPRRTIAAVTSVVACAAGVAIALNHGRAPSARALALAETPRINQELLAQAAPFMLLLGDSNGEGLGKVWSDCGMPVVNAAVGGLKAADVAEHLLRLDIRRAPAVSLIVVGTNDLAWKHDPSARRESWLRSIQSIALHMNKLGTKVVVSAIAPIQPSFGSLFDLQSVKSYSDGLDAMCDGSTCTFVDPWADARAESFVEAKSDAVPDGVHVGDYRQSVRKIARLVCSRLGQYSPALRAISERR